MSLNTVTLTWDFTDLLQNKVSATLTIRPVQLISSPESSSMIAGLSGSVDFYGSGQLEGIVANDNTGLNPSDSAYGVTVVSAYGHVLYDETVQILFANGATQDLSALTPVT